MDAVRDLQPPPPGEPPARLPLGEPGVLESLARRAGLEPLLAAEVDVPFEAPDAEALGRGLLSPGAVAPAIEHSGEDAVRQAVLEATAPFRRPDGSFRIENRFRYLIARA